MTLGFKTHINGNRTYFPEKIWSGIRHIEVTIELANYLHSQYAPKVNILDFAPKIHSIRGGKRWKPGMKIHMVINNRTKNRLQIAPVMEVTSVQDIRIRYDEIEGVNFQSSSAIFRNNRLVVVAVDNKLMPYEYVAEIAQNDGFDNISQFFNWFSADFEGQIIHWTNQKYQ